MMNKLKSKQLKQKGTAIFEVKDSEFHKVADVYKSSDLNAYNISDGYSFVSKSNNYMSRLENAEREFDKRFDIYISK